MPRRKANENSVRIEEKGDLRIELVGKDGKAKSFWVDRMEGLVHVRELESKHRTDPNDLGSFDHMDYWNDLVKLFQTLGVDGCTTIGVADKIRTAILDGFDEAKKDSGRTR